MEKENAFLLINANKLFEITLKNDENQIYQNTKFNLRHQMNPTMMLTIQSLVERITGKLDNNYSLTNIYFMLLVIENSILVWQVE